MCSCSSKSLFHFYYYYYFFRVGVEDESLNSGVRWGVGNVVQIGPVPNFLFLEFDFCSDII